MLDKYSHIYQDYLILGHSIGGQYEFYLKDLFETEEQALWAYKTVAERTERFEPPMWDKIEDYFFIFTNQTKEGYILWKFEVIKGKHANSGISIWNDEYELYVAEATKENYEKACEMVRDLFKEEK